MQQVLEQMAKTLFQVFPRFNPETKSFQFFASDAKNAKEITFIPLWQFNQDLLDLRGGVEKRDTRYLLDQGVKYLDNQGKVVVEFTAPFEAIPADLNKQNDTFFLNQGNTRFLLLQQEAQLLALLVDDYNAAKQDNNKLTFEEFIASRKSLDDAAIEGDNINLYTTPVHYIAPFTYVKWEIDINNPANWERIKQRQLTTNNATKAIDTKNKMMLVAEAIRKVKEANKGKITKMQRNAIATQFSVVASRTYHAEKIAEALVMYPFLDVACEEGVIAPDNVMALAADYAKLKDRVKTESPENYPEFTTDDNGAYTLENIWMDQIIPEAKTANIDNSSVYVVNVVPSIWKDIFQNIYDEYFPEDEEPDTETDELGSGEGSGEGSDFDGEEKDSKPTLSIEQVNESVAKMLSLLLVRLEVKDTEADALAHVQYLLNKVEDKTLNDTGRRYDPSVLNRMIKPLETLVNASYDTIERTRLESLKIEKAKELAAMQKQVDKAQAKLTEAQADEKQKAKLPKLIVELDTAKRLLTDLRVECEELGIQVLDTVEPDTTTAKDLAPV